MGIKTKHPISRKLIKGSIGFFMILLLVIFYIYFSPTGTDKNYYNQNREIPLYIDELYLLEQIQKNDNAYKSSNTVSTLPDSYYTETPFKRLLKKNNYSQDLSLKITADQEDDYSYFINEKYSKYLEDEWDDIVLKALYCDILGFSDADFNVLLSRRNFNGDYNDTHVYLSLLLLQENKCFEGDKLDESITTLETTLLDVQNKEDNFTDIFTERIVMLFWGGKGDSVKEEWITIIEEARNADGGWPIKDTFLAGSDPHATGLALLSLLYYDEGISKQDIYVQP